MRDIYTDENLLMDNRPVPARFIYITTTEGYEKLIQITKAINKDNFVYMLEGFREAVHHSYGAAVMFRAGLFYSFIHEFSDNSMWHRGMESLFKNFLFFKSPRADIPLDYVRKDRPTLSKEQMKRVSAPHIIDSKKLREGITHVPVAASYLAGGYNIENFGGCGDIQYLEKDLF